MFDEIDRSGTDFFLRQPAGLSVAHVLFQSGQVAFFGWLPVSEFKNVFRSSDMGAFQRGNLRPRVGDRGCSTEDKP